MLLLCLSLTFGLLANSHCPGQGEDRTAIYAKARLDTMETDYGPLYVLHVKGTPREIGLQYGYYLNDKIQKLFQGYADWVYREAGVPASAFSAALEPIWQRLQPQVPAEYIEEMDGIIDGAADAGVKLEHDLIGKMIAVSNVSDIDLMNLLPKEGENIPENGPQLAGFSCSSFAAWGSRTIDRKFFGTRNLDWTNDSGIQEYRLITVYQPVNGVGFLTVGYAGFIGALAGMNEYGITVGEIGSANANQTLDGKPWVLKTRDTLSYAQNLDRAIEAFSMGPNTIGYNFVIGFGDPQGNGAAARACAVETNAEYTAVLYDNDPLEQNAHVIDRDMNPVLNEQGEKMYYGYPLPEAVYRADASFDPRIRKDQSSSHGPADAEYDPASGYISGDPRGSGAYENRYLPQYAMIKALAEGSGYSRDGREILPKTDEKQLIGLAESILIARTVAMDSNVFSAIYGATDLDLMVAYEKGTGDSWVRASDNEYFHLNLAELLQSN
jgi:hypothetical protein